MGTATVLMPITSVLPRDVRVSKSHRNCATAEGAAVMAAAAACHGTAGRRKETMMRMMRRSLVTGMVLAIIPAVAMAQRGTITGRVVNRENTQPLVGVSVAVAGTTLGGITNQDGRFVIAQVPVGQRELRVTLLGFKGVVQPV